MDLCIRQSEPDRRATERSPTLLEYLDFSMVAEVVLKLRNENAPRSELSLHHPNVQKIL